MRLSKQNNMTLLLLAGLIVASGAFLATRSAAGTSATAAHGERFTDYRRPTGVELTPTAVANSAIKYAREAGEAGSVTMIVGHGSFAQAKAVLDGKAPAEAETAPSTTTSCFTACTAAEVGQHNTEMAELNQSGAYLVEIKGRHFTPPNAHVRRGQALPSGQVETLVLDSHTGFPEELQIGGPPPKVNQLGQVTEVRVAAQANSGQLLATRHNKQVGSLLGRVDIGHKPASGVRVWLGKTQSTNTLTDGTFSFQAVAGTYVVRAVHSGCLAQRKRIVAERDAHVVIACPKR